MILGTTFSSWQCEYLKVDDPQSVLKNVLANSDYVKVRLAAYWNRIELKSEYFDFQEIDDQLKTCRAKGVQVILTVGMKAPRWPEYHVPQWANSLSQEELYFYALRFVDRVMLHMHQFADVITYVQVENEPFHKFDVNANRSLPYSFVKSEVDIVRSYLRKDQKVALTCGLSMTVPLHCQDLYALFSSLRIADIVGFNVYVKMGVAKGKYLEVHRLYFAQLKLYKWIAELCGKQTFIAEMQDEPWEDGSMVHVGKESYPSWSEKQTVWLQKRLEDCGFEMILEWGCEWHYIKARLKK